MRNLEETLNLRSYNCPWEIERVGKMGDGGKWMCGMSRYEKNHKPCIIYSFGTSTNSPSASTIKLTNFPNRRPERVEFRYFASIPTLQTSTTKANPRPEQEMLERTNCEIYGYDFSVDSFGSQITPEFRARTHFLKAGVASSTDKNRSPPFYTIQDLMEMNHHEYMYAPARSPITVFGRFRPDQTRPELTGIVVTSSRSTSSTPSSTPCPR
jgi:hypothetical protein